LALALISAMIDLILGIKSGGRGFGPMYLRQFGLPVPGIVLLATGSALAVLWLCVGWPLVRWKRLAPFATLMSLGTVLAVVGYISGTTDPFRTHNVGGTLVDLTRIGIAGTIPAILLYRLLALPAIRKRHRLGDWAGRVAIALTFTAVIFWAFRYLLPGGASPVWWGLVAAALIGLVAGTVVLKGSLGWLVLAVVALIFAGPHLPLPDSALRIEGTTSREPGRKVILLTVDTLRSDVLTPYGADPKQSPHLQEFAADSVVFERAISAGSWTLPGSASMLTGLSVAVHQVRRLHTPLSEDIDTLAEYLQRNGLVTAAVGGNAHLASPGLQFDQGFDRYYFQPMSYGGSLGGKVYNWYHHNLRTSGPATPWLTGMALDWLRENHDQDFFLWLHYFDPHLGYEPPEEYYERGQDDGGRVGYATTTKDLRRIRNGEFVPRMNERERIQGLYDAEVRYVDDGIGEILTELKSLGIYDETLIVFSSDHGEELFDHGGFEHGHTVFEELLDVPLIIKGSGDALPMGTRFADPVATESIVPTVLDLMGLRFDPRRFTSASLKPKAESTGAGMGSREAQVAALDGAEAEVSGAEGSGEEGTDAADGSVSLASIEPIFSQGGLFYESRVAIRMGRYKYIVGLVAGHEELYDLETDPGELYSLGRELPEIVVQGRDALGKHQEQAEALQKSLGIEITAIEISDETRRQLEALGYMN